MEEMGTLHALQYQSSGLTLIFCKMNIIMEYFDKQSLHGMEVSIIS